MIRVAINGFGRIGRNVFKAGFERDDIEFVAVNDLTDNDTLAYLLKYDSVYGRYDKEIQSTDDDITIGGKKIITLSEKDPSKLPWKDLDIDVVIESTGIFRTEDKAKMHIDAGAKRVVISAPNKGGNVQTHVIGVNDKSYNPNQLIVDNASCTTNCVAPIAAIMHSAFGVKKAMMSTVHAYTAAQSIVDGPAKDKRRGRAAAMNIIPTTTGAAKATAHVIPELDGLFDGISIRVPVVTGSLSDFTFLVDKATNVDAVNQAFWKAKENPFFSHVIDVTDEPLVSTDIIGSPYSAIVDTSFTKVVDGDMVKILAWYDNEWGYSHRLIEMVATVGKALKK